MAFAADKTRQGAAGQGGFEIEQSLRFNAGDSPSLTKTPTSAGNRRTWTWSCWVKRGAKIGSYEWLFSANNTCKIAFNGNSINMYHGSELVTTQVFRDPSAWYHLVWAVDTTQATASNRMKFYVNGEQVTSFSTENYPAQNSDTDMNNTVPHYIGKSGNASYPEYNDGYKAEMYLIDGTALTPTSFGETGDYGEWKPIEVSGLTYGTNGFYLSFAGGGIMSATGGNSIATDGDYKVHSFTSNGTFTPTITGFNQSDVEYLVIAGGGGGGGGHGGGGGAGGYKTGFLGVTTATGYGITVGAGGAPGTQYVSPDAEGDSGTNSVFSTITSTGGGGGGGYNGDSGTGRLGKDGGSGGGGVGQGTAASTGGSASPAGQGNDGGDMSGSGAGGGGGAGAAGANAGGSGGTATGGTGGNGLSSSITGAAVTRAGGGGGGNASGVTPGSGGSGGGGVSSSSLYGDGTAGTPNTGSGGGGGGGGNPSIGTITGGLGGSGIVIIRYKFQ
jgi:hypothetical protein